MDQPSPRRSRGGRKGKQNRPWPGEALLGFFFGALLWLGLIRLAGNPFNFTYWEELTPAAGALGAALAVTRARWVLTAAAVVVCAPLLLIGATPVMERAAQGLVRSDPLAHADAVVVLSADLHPDGEPSDLSFERIVRGLEVLRLGDAPRMVVSKLAVRRQSYVPGIHRQMQRLGFDAPVLEIGPVFNTHDEALAVARLAREQGWQRVILVTSPLHSRRAVATFRKAGVQVLSAPCIEHQFDLVHLKSMDDRIAAFQSWLHEVVGYESYRRRGWL